MNEVTWAEVEAMMDEACAAVGEDDEDGSGVRAYLLKKLEEVADADRREQMSSMLDQLM